MIAHTEDVTKRYPDGDGRASATSRFDVAEGEITRARRPVRLRQDHRRCG